jgi:hypothetical protein
MLATDLKVTAGDGQAELATARFGVRLLLSEKTFDTPAFSATVPGPVLAMRLPDGTWFGGSRLYGNRQVKSFVSKVLAPGPVFARVETVYTYVDGGELKVTVQVSAGDYAMRVDTDVSKEGLDDGWELSFAGGVSVREAILHTDQRNYSTEVRKKLEPNPSQPAWFLTPWTGDKWFPDCPSAFRLLVDGKETEVVVTARDSGAWVVPQERPVWANFTRWTYDMIEVIWAGWRGKRIPVFVRDNGVAMRMNLAPGARKWVVGAGKEGTRLLERYTNKFMSVHSPLPRLNEVKDMVLEWPDGPEKHPYLFLNAEELEAAGKRSPAALAEARDVNALRSTLDLLGSLDLMRGTMAVAARYDTIIDSGQITAEERRLFRAQAAYLAYVCADPFHWSFERGQCSGNPNMTVSRVMNLGILACALRDHPMGKKWATWAVDWMKYWLAEVTDETGGWPESSHYARVSWSDFVQMAIVARKAGLHDFFVDPKFRAMALFYEKTLTPPDPLRRAGGAHPDSAVRPGVRVGAPYGRGTRGDAWGLSGLLAAATAKSDPAFSKIMQWSWRESGFNENWSHSTAGLSSLYVDRGLPAEPPSWQSEFYPSVGYLLRSRVGSENEDYLLFVSQYYQCADGQIWPPHTGSIMKWFCNGRPIGGEFPRFPETSHVLLGNRVMLACNWDPKAGQSPETGYFTQTRHLAFASLPALEYVNVEFEIPEFRTHFLKMPPNAPAFPVREKTGNPPFKWQRQLLLARDGLPGGQGYLVLRDTVSGGQPTQWHFWTLSEKLGTPEEAKDRDAFLKDKPGANVAPLRTLAGDRFTALGQFDVDTEYYVASPSDTPRYTLRYGVVGSAYGTNNFSEFQDLLHLQLMGDGCYFVAVVPKPRAEAAPSFATLAGGTVIKLAGGFGTDYCFLAKESAKAEAGEASFEGTCAAVQARKEAATLVLAAPGTVRYQDFGLAAPVPASLGLLPQQAVLSLPAGSPGGEVTLQCPGRWSLAKGQGNASISKRGKSYLLTVPAGTRSVTLGKSP